MTAKDVDKIDRALKNRPSRMEYILEFQNPTYDKRVEMLNYHGAGPLTEDLA